ncbi:hypothetical protein JMJ35_002428 [Cladonia borealis]|uniref:Uncharacterized protein n=1 Tax=Cladonia borealis TaxID=184061 RepID=A0AA39R7C8_9LECA|nr:hypothetical protein JMJ35_002428 [Cladonia borealis]
MPRKRQSTGNSVDSKSNLKQVQFPAPKRTIKERGPTWSAPSKFQQTITQMNPSIYIPKPEYEGLTTDDDQEQESYIASPVRRKRRKITPAKTSSRRTGTRSAQRQTITQMDPFRALYHPDVEEENLDDLEDEHKENNVPSPIKRRKRKVSPERAPSGKFRKRRLKQEVSQIEHQLGRETEYDEQQHKQGSRPWQQKSSGKILPPPVTPRSQRKKEIPSSQSPADTPLSTQSRRSFQAYSRSPLKERSTNIGPAKTSCRDGARGRKRVEIADSLESREDESPVLMHDSTSMTASTSENASKFGGIFSQMPMDSKITQTAALDRSSEKWQWHETEGKVSDRDILGREIVDSNEEDDDDDPDISLARQTSLHSKDTSLTQQRAPDTQRDLFRAAGSSSSSQSPQQSNLRNRSSIERFGLTKHISTQPTLSPPSIPPFHRTDSEQASAQLLKDLHRITEPVLETESQYEAGWNTYHPPTNDNDSPPTLLSSPPPLESPSSASMTVPTQLPPPRTVTADYPTQPTTSTQLKLPVPPSQATTTDTTQPSPRKIPSSQFFPSPYKLPTFSKTAAAFPSSPPPMPPPSSSSLVADESTAAGWKWNGVRLTDSQLLPESLLNDSLIGPVGGFGLSQESLEEE